MTTHTATTTPDISVQILVNHEGPRGKVADAEVAFHTGPFAGLKLVGFAIWERRSGAGHNVTFPARQYFVNGERRSYALLRPAADPAANEAVPALILEAYARYEAGTSSAGTGA